MIGIWWPFVAIVHYILPGPARVWDALRLIETNGDLWNNLGITFWRVTVGFELRPWVGLCHGIVLERTSAPAISSSR